MPDPVHAYGWREVSQRPSFGSVREWLYGCFVYNTRQDVFDEGMRRFAAFGLDLGTYRSMEPDAARAQINKDLRSKYYGADGEWFASIRKTFGVTHFVFDKTNMTSPSSIPVVYENAGYVVGRLP